MASHIPNTKPSSSTLAACRELHVPGRVVRATLDVLQQFGAHGCEGLVLWLGQVHGDIARVSRAAVPPQRPIKEERGVGYFVEGDALFQLNRELSASGDRLLAQVHSHPGRAYHSETDDRYAIVTTDGGFSLVVPQFGAAPADLGAWANYRLHGREWRELQAAEVRRTLLIKD